MATSDNKKSILLAAQLAERITPAHRKPEVNWVIDQIRGETPVLQIARHVARDLSPNVRKAVIQSLVLNGMLQSSSTRTAFHARTGAHTPLVLLISPTMRCNLACEGCYAAEYSSDVDMSPELLQSIIDQANEIGIYIFTILGGEPFLRQDLLDVGAANPDSFFQVFTNGTLLGDASIARLTEIGNVAPVLSIEGDREATDDRRGEGVYDLTMETMDRLGAGRRGVRVLGHGHAPQLPLPHEPRVLRRDDRQGRRRGLELPVHARRSRSGHEPDARAGRAQRVPRERARVAQGRSRWPLWTSGATRSSSAAASPGSGMPT